MRLKASFTVALQMIVVRHSERSLVIMPFPQRGEPEKFPLSGMVATKDTPLVAPPRWSRRASTGRVAPGSATKAPPACRIRRPTPPCPPRRAFAGSTTTPSTARPSRCARSDTDAGEASLVRNDGDMPAAAAAGARRLDCRGRGERPLTLGMSELMESFPVVSITAVLESASRPGRDPGFRVSGLRRQRGHLDAGGLAEAGEAFARRRFSVTVRPPPGPVLSWRRLGMWLATSSR